MPDEPTGASPPATELVLYQTEDGRTRVQVRLDEGTVWLSQRLMAELFQVSVPTINEHVGNVFDEGEAEPAATIRKFRTVQTEGKREVSRLVDFYNLDVILAVGYRVRSHRGTQFRRWATERLREYVVKGFVLDDERLRQGKAPGPDYFDELLERIRDIRASEKRFYEKLRDLWKLAVDYDAKSEQTREFFQIVQNKLHWATTGRTGAELIAERADDAKPNMGLTTWKGAKVRKGDVAVAKNYLNEDEIRSLNRSSRRCWASSCASESGKCSSRRWTTGTSIRRQRLCSATRGRISESCSAAGLWQSKPKAVRRCGGRSPEGGSTRR